MMRPGRSQMAEIRDAAAYVIGLEDIDLGTSLVGYGGN